MGPVFLALPSSTCEMSDQQTSAKEYDGAIKEDFETLIVAQMEAGYRDIPEQAKHSAAKQYDDAGEIFRPCAPVAGLIVVRTHRLRPSEK
jgi:hypothetical protein